MTSTPHPRPSIAGRALSAALLASACALALPSVAADAPAEHAPARPTWFGAGDKFAEPTGVAIYEGICQGCHMPGGKGAVGAGKYPALAGDTNLASKNYMLYTILNGRKAMPPFATALNDEQVAEVVNYVRSHFGNAYTDALTAAEVKTARTAQAVGAADR